MKNNFISGFRNAIPYINRHHGKTFVLALSGEVIANPLFQQLTYDITMVHNLGVKVIIVHDFEYQIINEFKQKNIEEQYHKGRPITQPETLHSLEQIAGQTRIKLEACFSRTQTQLPSKAHSLKLCSGNYVSAKPLGVIDGIDMAHTGCVRNIDSKTIISNLDQHQLVLLSTLAYSSSAERYRLSINELAIKTALSTQADKLIIFQKNLGLNDQNGALMRQACSLDHSNINPEQLPLFTQLNNAVNNGIPRAHILSYCQDGALLQEMYTHLGAGTLISKEPYESYHQATPNDISAIIDLITPYEDQGILVKRSRTSLEDSIESFTVIECDEHIIGCAALNPFGQKYAEISCIVTQDSHQKKGLATKLLESIENTARQKGFEILFALTTQTTDWFLDKGFIMSSLSDLPESKQRLYNHQRNSKVLIKSL
jgi:amino-acid N-acetyltransferase